MCSSSDPTVLLREALDALAGQDAAVLAEGAVGDQVVELERLAARLDAERLRRLAVFDARGGAAADGAVSTKSWLRTQTRMSAASASRRVAVARELRHLPGTAAALAAGDISFEHAEAITRAVGLMDRDTVRAAEATLLEAARALDPVILRRVVHHLRERVDPDGSAWDAEKMHARRGLSLSELLDGMVRIDGYLDPEAGATVMAAIHALSAPGPIGVDTRSPAQRRADALHDLARGALDSGELPQTGGEKPHLTVIVPIDILHRHHDTAADDAASSAGADGTAGQGGTGGQGPTGGQGSTGGQDGAGGQGGAPGQDSTPGPGTSPAAAGFPLAARAAELGFLGVINTDTARRLACDCVASRVVTGPGSEPLDIGRATRTVPTAIRRALTIRDQGCTAPGCDVPPPWTDAHHVIHWADGGPTSLDNLRLLCRRHHRAEHEGHAAARPPPRRHAA